MESPRCLLPRDRHYLYVIGPNASEIVSCVGGWLFDRVMAGWDVTVFVEDFQNAWPLRILGVRADNYQSAVASMEDCPGHGAVAVAAQTFHDDVSIRGLVRMALNDRACEVTMWGDVRSVDLAAYLPMTSHRLGPAAAAFKRHALAAATVFSSGTTVSEVFYSTSAPPPQRAIVHAGSYSIKSVNRKGVMR